MIRKPKNVLVTGGAGFIGSNFIRYLFDQSDDVTLVNLDKLTYAGNLMSLADIDEKFGGTRYHFRQADITDLKECRKIIEEFQIDTVVHFAAESHVDRSIEGPADFIRSNINGTFILLDILRDIWKGREDVLFHHVSTDEVFGSLGSEGFFHEKTPYDPRSPYSASKASSDHLVRAYHHTFGLPVTISNCTNNYGPYQFPEKLIPVMIENMLAEKPLPVYGDGKNIRDWLYVEDHSAAIWSVATGGKSGETYLVGGENEWENIKLVNVLCEVTADKAGKPGDYYKKLISFVKDRPGHDRRYAVDCSKIKQELGWKQSVTFREGLEKTVDWYLENRQWVESVKSGDYREWMEKNYGLR
ncbi:MAG: dTDP-glucose 4,6-dehydratase [Spirochaetia bacterium]